MDEHTRDQFNRIFSHIESEDRNRHAISRNVDLLQNNLIKTEKVVDKHDQVLFNNGKGGLVQLVDRLIQAHENNDKAWHRWAAVIGGLSGIAALLLEIFKR